MGGTDCQATKYISSSKVRCTIPPKNHDTTHNITVRNGGTASSGQTVTYNNQSQGSMQDFNSQKCQNLKRGQAVVLTDTRISKGESKGRDYRVKKMPDDKCWMIDNLRYAHNSWSQPGHNQYMTKTGYVDPENDSNWNVWRYISPGWSTNGCSPGSQEGCYGYLYNGIRLLVELVSILPQQVKKMLMGIFAQIQAQLILHMLQAINGNCQLADIQEQIPILLY